MEDLGFITLIIISFFTFLLSLKILVFEKFFLLHSLSEFFYYMAITSIILPDQTSVTFENMAWSMSQQGIYSLILNFSGPSNQFISWLIAIPYSLFRSIIMAQSISLFLAYAMSIFRVTNNCKENLERTRSIKVSSVLGISIFNFYSEITIYVCFFLLAFKYYLLV